MVSPQMLGVEMLVEHGHEEQAAQVLFPATATMNEFVGGDDRKAGGTAHDRDDHRHVDRKNALRRKHAGELKDDQELEASQCVDQQVEGPLGNRIDGLSTLGFVLLIDE